MTQGIGLSEREPQFINGTTDRIIQELLELMYPHSKTLGTVLVIRHRMILTEPSSIPSSQGTPAAPAWEPRSEFRVLSAFVEHSRRPIHGAGGLRLTGRQPLLHRQPVLASGMRRRRRRRSRRRQRPGPPPPRRTSRRWTGEFRRRRRRPQESRYCG